MEKNQESTTNNCITRAIAHDLEHTELVFATAFADPPLLFESSKPPKKEEKTEENNKTEISSEAIQKKATPTEIVDSPIVIQNKKEEKEQEEEPKDIVVPDLIFAEAPIDPPADEDSGEDGGAGGDSGGEDDNPIQKKTNKETSIGSGESNNSIPKEVMSKMQSTMGADFSGVKIHTNSQSAKDAGALAYTKGESIDFAPGQFNPKSQDGQKLLGHELTHVVQQRQGRVKPTTSVNGMSVNDDAGLEKEADVMGAKAASSSPPVQKKVDKNIGSSSFSSQPLQAKVAQLYAIIQLSDAEKAKVRNLIQNGCRNENILTNEIFYDRHPDKRGKRLIHPSQDPEEQAMVREWSTIRNTIVRPELNPNEPGQEPEEPIQEEPTGGETGNDGGHSQNPEQDPENPQNGIPETGNDKESETPSTTPDIDVPANQNGNTQEVFDWENIGLNIARSIFEIGRLAGPITPGPVPIPIGPACGVLAGAINTYQDFTASVDTGDDLLVALTLYRNIVNILNGGVADIRYSVQIIQDLLTASGVLAEGDLITAPIIEICAGLNLAGDSVLVISDAVTATYAQLQASKLAESGADPILQGQYESMAKGYFANTVADTISLFFDIVDFASLGFLQGAAIDKFGRVIKYVKSFSDETITVVGKVSDILIGVWGGGIPTKSEPVSPKLEDETIQGFNIETASRDVAAEFLLGQLQAAKTGYQLGEQGMDFFGEVMTEVLDKADNVARNLTEGEDPFIFIRDMAIEELDNMDNSIENLQQARVVSSTIITAADGALTFLEGLESDINSIELPEISFPEAELGDNMFADAAEELINQGGDIANQGIEYIREQIQGVLNGIKAKASEMVKDAKESIEFAKEWAELLQDTLDRQIDVLQGMITDFRDMLAKCNSFEDIINQMLEQLSSILGLEETITVDGILEMWHNAGSQIDLAFIDLENWINENVREESSQGKFINSPIQKKDTSENNDTKASILPEDNIMQKMEAAFGTSFSDVNIHENSSKASEAGALAYAQGTDIHFAPGQFKPNTQSGQELIGHELTHVVQQKAGRVKSTTQHKGMAVNNDPGLEKEADEMGAKFADSLQNNSDEPTQNKYGKGFQLSESSSQKQNGPIQKKDPEESKGKNASFVFDPYSYRKQPFGAELIQEQFIDKFINERGEGLSFAFSAEKSGSVQLAWFPAYLAAGFELSVGVDYMQDFTFLLGANASIFGRFGAGKSSKDGKKEVAVGIGASAGYSYQWEFSGSKAVAGSIYNFFVSLNNKLSEDKNLSDEQKKVLFIPTKDNDFLDAGPKKELEVIDTRGEGFLKGKVESGENKNEKSLEGEVNIGWGTSDVTHKDKQGDDAGVDRTSTETSFTANFNGSFEFNEKAVGLSIAYAETKVVGDPNVSMNGDFIDLIVTPSFTMSAESVHKFFGSWASKCSPLISKLIDMTSGVQGFGDVAVLKAAGMISDAVKKAQGVGKTILDVISAEDDKTSSTYTIGLPFAWKYQMQEDNGVSEAAFQKFSVFAEITKSLGLSNERLDDSFGVGGTLKLKVGGGIGDSSLYFIKQTYIDAPESDKGVKADWNKFKEGNKTEIATAIFNCVYNDGAGPGSNSSAGSSGAYMSLFSKIKNSDDPLSYCQSNATSLISDLEKCFDEDVEKRSKNSVKVRDFASLLADIKSDWFNDNTKFNKVFEMLKEQADEGGTSQVSEFLEMTASYGIDPIEIISIIGPYWGFRAELFFKKHGIAYRDFHQRTTETDFVQYDRLGSLMRTNLEGAKFFNILNTFQYAQTDSDFDKTLKSEKGETILKEKKYPFQAYNPVLYLIHSINTNGGGFDKLMKDWNEYESIMNSKEQRGYLSTVAIILESGYAFKGGKTSENPVQKAENAYKFFINRSSEANGIVRESGDSILGYNERESALIDGIFPAASKNDLLIEALGKKSSEDNTIESDPVIFVFNRVFSGISTEVIISTVDTVPGLGRSLQPLFKKHGIDYKKGAPQKSNNSSGSNPSSDKVAQPKLKAQNSNADLVQKKEDPQGNDISTGTSSPVKDNGLIPSGVNVHQNSSQATEMGALAFAQGSDIHFAPGQFKPDTKSGQELIGHELAHVQQQKEDRVKPSFQLKEKNINNDSKLEKEADDYGVAFAKSFQNNNSAEPIQNKFEKGFQPSNKPIQKKEKSSNNNNGSGVENESKSTNKTLPFQLKTENNTNSINPEQTLQLKPKTKRTVSDYRSYVDIMALTIAELVNYSIAQADWHASETLDDSQREIIRTLLRNIKNRSIQFSLGSVVTSTFKTKVDADINNYEYAEYYGDANFDNPFNLPKTDQLSNAACAITLDTALSYGKDLKKLRNGFGDIVVKRALKYAQFIDLRTKGYVDDVITYHNNTGAYFEAENGRDFISYILMKDSGTDPETYHTNGIISPYIRSYHRFNPAGLNQLETNFQGGNIAQKPLCLILHTAEDHNGAFHRDSNLDAVISNSNIFTLMVEGEATLNSMSAQIGPLAKKHGLGGKIDQVMIAGHGNTGVTGMAGTVDRNATDTKKVVKGEGVDINEWQKDKAGTWNLETMKHNDKNSVNKFMDTILDNMDLDGSTDARNSNRKILFNACLNRSNSVNAPIDSTNSSTAAGQIQKQIQKNPSIAEYMNQKIRSRGIATDHTGVTAIGSHGSFNSTAELVDPSGTLNLTNKQDPELSSTDKWDYLEKGTNPLGVMRVALEAWGEDQARFLGIAKVRKSNWPAGNRGVRPWNKQLILKGFDRIVNLYSSNGEGIRKTGKVIGDLEEFNDIVHFKKFSLIERLANSSYKDDTSAILQHLKSKGLFGSSLRKLCLNQLLFLTQRSASNSAATEFLTALANDYTCNSARPFVNTSFIDSLALLGSLISGGGNKNGRLKMSLLAIQHINPIPQEAKDLVKPLINADNEFITPKDINDAIGSNSELSIRQKLGIAPVTGGVKLDPKSEPDEVKANVKIKGSKKNNFHITPMTSEGVVSTKSAKIYRTPSIYKGSVGRKTNGDALHIIGQSIYFYAIEHKYKKSMGTAYIRKNRVTIK